jgi:hypothetical protein
LPTSFARAAEAVPRIKAAVRAIFVLADIGDLLWFASSHPAGARTYLVDMNAGANPPDVLRESIAEGHREAGKAHEG